MPSEIIDESLQEYLHPTWFIDSDHAEIIRFAHEVVADAGISGEGTNEGEEKAVERAVALFYAVRDGIRYDPYVVRPDPSMFKASNVLKAKVGFCIHKAILLAATARALAIPSRLGFADIRNHLSTTRLTAFLQTDIFVFHGYTELFLDGKWLKATPAFNRSLCERFHYLPLEFDGKHDSLLHPVDGHGREHTEYLRDHGQFADLPIIKMVTAFQEAYPHLFEGADLIFEGDFEEEIMKDQRANMG